MAAVFRLWGLGGQPVIYFDSGVYLGEGAFLSSAAQRALGAVLASGPPGPLERVARATEQGTDAHPPDIAKPGHSLLVASAMLVLGKSSFAGALVSALAGIGTVVVTYLIAVRYWGQRVAVAAAVLLAISGQHLVYSREPLVESDGMFFALLASLVYLRSTRLPPLLLAGALFGVAFTCNNRISYLPAVFLLAELPFTRATARRGLVFGLGFVLPLATIELGYLAARAVGRLAQVRTDWLDYAQQLATFQRMNPPDRLRFDQWPTYFVDVALMDGLGVLTLLLIGIAVAVGGLMQRPWRRADLLLVASLLVPLVLYSVYSTGEVRMRHFSLALPWVMLAAAIGLDRLARVFGARRTQALGGALAVLVALALPRTLALVTPANGMPQVLNYVSASGRVASTNGPVLGFELGEDRTNARLREAFVNTPADLESLRSTYAYLVVDLQAWVFPGPVTERYTRATPLLTVAHANDAWYLADLLEHYGVAWGGWDQLLTIWRTNSEAASQLRVYALSDLQP